MYADQYSGLFFLDTLRDASQRVEIKRLGAELAPFMEASVNFDAQSAVDVLKLFAGSTLLLRDNRRDAAAVAASVTFAGSLADACAIKEFRARPTLKKARLGSKSLRAYNPMDFLRSFHTVLMTHFDSPALQMNDELFDQVLRRQKQGAQLKVFLTKMDMDVTKVNALISERAGMTWASFWVETLFTSEIYFMQTRSG